MAYQHMPSCYSLLSLLAAAVVALRIHYSLAVSAVVLVVCAALHATYIHQYNRGQAIKDIHYYH